jgi:hypothetical protein
MPAMIGDYRRVLAAAAARAAPAAVLPPHLRDAAGGLMERTLDRLGVPVPWSKI